MSFSIAFGSTGKRLFITGGSRGLGREMALAIADAGADVILVGRDRRALEKTAGDIRALGRQAWTIQADVGNPTECEAACQPALARVRPDRHPDQQRRRPAREHPHATRCRWKPGGKLIDLNLTSAFSARS